MSTLQALQHIRTHNLTGIKAGPDRDTFLDIWMVVVEDRIFARSWGLAPKSWYNTFLAHPFGQIKCGDQIWAVQARPLTDDPAMTQKINQAYLDKYDTDPHNAFYAKGIISPQHAQQTMELIVLPLAVQP